MPSDASAISGLKHCQGHQRCDSRTQRSPAARLNAHRTQTGQLSYPRFSTHITPMTARRSNVVRVTCRGGERTPSHGLETGSAALGPNYLISLRNQDLQLYFAT